GFPLGRGADVARLAFGGRLHRGGLSPSLVGDLARLQARCGDDALGLPLGLTAVVVGLLLGQPEDLLDAGAQTRKRPPAVLLQLLVGIGELLLDLRQALFRLTQPALRLSQPLLGLSARLLCLGDRGGEPRDVTVYLLAVVSTKDDAELLTTRGIVKE